MILSSLSVFLSQESSTDYFQRAISSFRMDLSHYVGNAIGAGIVILAVVVVVGAVSQISKWMKKSRRK